MKEYLKKIYKSRHFWIHLSFADLRAKYRRSTLGLFWSILQPLGLTLLLSFVMGKLFNSPIVDYAPYIFSGLILWEFVVNSAISGSNAFINAEGYIKQISHPLAIYSLRSSLSVLINLMLAFVGFILWVLIWKPENFGYSWLHLIPAFIILFGIGVSFGTITGFINTKFRDFQQMLVLILQAVWYVSPIFFEPKLFHSVKAEYLIEWNPVYHILNLFRAPMLYGFSPTFNDYVFSLGTMFFLFLVAIYYIAKDEKKIIFYL
jgi:lipopolysaccharide transport system permease protein